MSNRKYPCKCQICRKDLTTDIAFQVVKGKRKCYYCSEEEYNAEQKKSEDRDNCYYTAGRIMRVPLIPPVMKQDINDLSKYYEFIVIEKTFKDQKEVIQRFLDRGTSPSEYARVKYVMTIIRSNINRIYEQYKKEEQAKRMLFSQSTQQTIDINVMNNMDNKPVQKVQKNVKDISAWL